MKKLQSQERHAIRIIFQENKFAHTEEHFNPIKDGHFGDCPPPPVRKIYHSYPTMMKCATVTPCLEKIQKIYQSRDTPPKFY